MQSKKPSMEVIGYGYFLELHNIHYSLFDMYTCNIFTLRAKCCHVICLKIVCLFEYIMNPLKSDSSRADTSLKWIERLSWSQGVSSSRETSLVIHNSLRVMLKYRNASFGLSILWLWKFLCDVTV